LTTVIPAHGADVVLGERETDGVGELRVTFYREPAVMDEVRVEVEPAREAGP
jgi:hypothetical protein